MATNISTLVPDVRAVIPEVPTFIVTRQVIRAMREFCEETRAWRVDVNLSTVENASTYNLTGLLPTNTELVEIISVKSDEGNAPVEPITTAWLDHNKSTWRDETSSEAMYFYLVSNNTIRLVPTPSATATNKYFVRLAVKPLLTATTFDDQVDNKYNETLISGALANLLMIPRKPWTDFSLGDFYRRKFEAAFAPARAEATDEFQTGVARKVRYGGL